MNETSRKTLSYLVGNRQTISAQQTASIKQRSPRGQIWVSKFHTHGPPPESTAQELLCRAIHQNQTRDTAYQDPGVGPGSVESYWTGFRPGVGEKEPEAQLSEQEKYAAIQATSTSSTVIFYMYGGAFYMNEPGTYRKLYSALARATGARAYCVRQRLSPQSPFPAAILDCLHGYLSLLAPPPGAFHDPVPSSSIVLCGDSSGANMALGLMQVLLTIKREGWASTIPFFGRAVDVKDILPAGLAIISPVCDLTNGFPSWKGNASHDTIPEGNPVVLPNQPVCDLWPTKPPRGHVYCDIPTLLHPFVSPALNANWTGAPPMWISCGQERLADSIRNVAQEAHKQGVRVQFSEYEMMPHNFSTVYANAPQSKDLMQAWAAAILAVQDSQTFVPGAVLVCVEGGKKQLSLDSLVPHMRHEVYARAVQNIKDWPIFTRVLPSLL